MKFVVFTTVRMIFVGFWRRVGSLVNGTVWNKHTVRLIVQFCGTFRSNLETSVPIRCGWRAHTFLCWKSVLLLASIGGNAAVYCAVLQAQGRC